MQAPLVENLLPQTMNATRPAPPRSRQPREAERDAPERQSFDRCLESARQASTQKKPDAKERTDTKADAPSQKKASANKAGREGKDDAKPAEGKAEADATAATDALLSLLVPQDAAEVRVTFEEVLPKATAIPVQAAQAKDAAAPAADQGAAPVGEQPGAKSDFMPQLRQAEAAQPQKAPQQERPAEAGPDIAAQTDTAKPRAEAAPVKDEPEPEPLQAGGNEAPKREPAKILDPAPPAPEPSRAAEQTVTLRAGETIRVEGRAAGPAARAGAAAVDRNAPAGDAPVMGQVVRGASMMLSQGRSEVRVQLRPPELGSVRVELVSDRNNVLEARIVTEREEVRQLVERNLPQLREALAATGVSVGNFDVSTQHPGQAPLGQQPGGGPGLGLGDAEAEAVQSGPALGVNRLAGSDAIDYII